MQAKEGEEEGPKKFLRFFVCRGDPLGSQQAWVGLKFCNTNSLESFPAVGALSPFCFPLNGEINAGKSLSTEEVGCGKKSFCIPV